MINYAAVLLPEINSDALGRDRVYLQNYIPVFMMVQIPHN